MKKIVLAVLILFAGASLYAGAGVRLNLKGGVLTDTEFKFKPLIWTAGIDVDIHVNDVLLITPEAQLVFSEFQFKDILLYPACTVNAVLGGFFVGGGLGKWMYIASGEKPIYDKDFTLKLNAGLINDRFKLAAYVITPFDNILKKYYTIVGATLGLRF